MTFRRAGSIVQLAVFVVGGILGPVWHLAHHQNDHTHGGAQSTGHPHEHRIVDDAALVDWPSPEHHADSSGHAPIVAEGAHEHAPPTAPESNAPQTPLDHGRGSVAHLGLVLFGAPALLPVPRPERGEHVFVVAAIAALSLFQPPCPLQRPPPSRIA